MTYGALHDSAFKKQLQLIHLQICSLQIKMPTYRKQLLALIVIIETHACLGKQQAVYRRHWAATLLD